MEHVVIVGAGAAGLTAAETLRRSKYPGRITLIGAEPTLPYDRPPLSKRVLSGEWQPAETALRSASDIEALGLDLRLGVRAEGLSLAQRRLALSDGSGTSYDGLIVATGVRPRRCLGQELEGVHGLRSLTDAVRLRDRLTPGRRLVIIGAGLIGAEVAAVARRRGVQVWLVEPNPAPLVSAVGAVTAEFLASEHRDAGVVLRTGVSAVDLCSASGRVTAVRLSDGTFLAADEVLVATGSLPNTEWLAGSSLALADKGLADGIGCDEFCAAAPGVYAAGDVARWHNPLFGVDMRIEHRTNAGEQAMAAARNLLRPVAERTPFAPVPYFWSDQYDVKVSAYGYLRDHDEERLVCGDPASGRFLVAFRRGQLLGAVVSVGIAPKQLRVWRQAIADRTPFGAALTELPGSVDPVPAS